MWKCPVYASQDLMYVSNTPIDYILQKIGAPSYTTPSISEVEEAFEQHFIPTNIQVLPLPSLKMIKLYIKNLMLANIAQEIEVSMDTPFNVGSISKTILATGDYAKS